MASTYNDACCGDSKAPAYRRAEPSVCRRAYTGWPRSAKYFSMPGTASAFTESTRKASGARTTLVESRRDRPFALRTASSESAWARAGKDPARARYQVSPRMSWGANVGLGRSRAWLCNHACAPLSVLKRAITTANDAAPNESAGFAGTSRVAALALAESGCSESSVLGTVRAADAVRRR